MNCGRQGRLWLVWVTLLGWLASSNCAHGESLPTCFTQPQHQTDFTGTWAPRQTATWETCRMFDHYRNYSGGHSSPQESRRCDAGHRSHLQDSVRQRMQPADRLTPIDQDYEPNNCRLGPFDAQALLSSIGAGNTLWYVGDSISEQMFYTTGCLLEAAGSGPRWAGDEWKRLGSIPEEARPQKGGFIHGTHPFYFDSAVDPLYRKCLLVEDSAGGGDVRICGVFIPHGRLLLKTHPGLLQRIAGHPRDTVVMNLGLHYPNKYGLLAQDLTSILRKYSALRRGAGAARLVWREVSPQHFARSAGGLYHGHKVPVTEPCEAHAAKDTGIANGANLALHNTLINHTWVLRLPIWAMSAQRADAHTLTECTHWCQPGPVTAWVIMLQHLLQAQPPSETSVGAAMSITLQNRPPHSSSPSAPRAPPNTAEAPPAWQHSHAPPTFRAVQQNGQVLGLPTPPPSPLSAQALVGQKREQTRLTKRAAGLAAALADSARRTQQQHTRGVPRWQPAFGRKQ